MTTLKSFLVVGLMCVAITVLLINLENAHALVNYHNDPDLAKAMEFDSEQNGGNKENADRSQAEYYYLRYLENAKESFQRARVYCQLGSMYATSFNLQKGETKDRQKARDYYRKAVESEPNRIDACMIEARSMLVSLDHPYGFEQLKARVEVYRWLSEFDEQKVREKWLPLWPHMPPQITTVTDDRGESVARITRRPPTDPNSPVPGHIAGLMNLIASVKQMSIANAANWDTISMSVPEEGWAYILKHLPPDAPERKIVEKAMKEKRERLTDAALREVLESLRVDAEQDHQSSPSDSGQTERPHKELIIKERFIPHIEYAKERDLGFVLDLKTGEPMKAPMEVRFDDERTQRFLAGLGKGDIAWDGRLLATRGARLFSVLEESKRPMTRTAGKYGSKCQLPDNAHLPYTFAASTQEGDVYLLKIISIMPEGIRVLYRELAPSEIARYVAEKAN